jgi:arabinogalactan endo-1,4-beta-galactosidase
MKKTKKVLVVIAAVVTIATLSSCARESAGSHPGTLPAALPDPALFVKKVEGLDKHFVMGVDVSSVLALEKSGVVFRDASGQSRDLFATLADYGVNSVRLRVWNNPFDAAGHGYGGGNCDIATAIETGKRATENKLSVLLDFHYSDFWADPSKQQSPRAWENMSPDEKAEALYMYTKDCLSRALDAGVDVRMVQIGNETTASFCGEKNWINICKLLNAGSRAVRETAKAKHKKIEVAIHFTNPEKADSYERFAQILKKQVVDYDVFATSWYPYWHGTAENLTSVLKRVIEISGKKVMLAEFSYAYTSGDGDGFANTISAETMCEKPWPFTVQGQADALREAIAAIGAVGKEGVGVYYWEPAWLPVPGSNADERKKLWEKDGSGWATSYAAEYDPVDAGKYFGGTSWDNQALFDFDGMPLASLAVWSLVRSGSVASVRADSVDETLVRVRIGDAVELPDAVTVVFNNGERKTEAVVWDAVDARGSDEICEYVVSGLTASGLRTDAKVSIVEKNYVENASFEDADMSMWHIVNVDGVTTELQVQDKASDAKTGSKALHFWSSDKVSFTVEQTVTGLASGTYKFSVALHGGDAKNQDMQIYAVSGGKKMIQKTDVDGWRNFRFPAITGIAVSDGTVTVGVSIACDANGWGSIDDFALSPTE